MSKFIHFFTIIFSTFSVVNAGIRVQNLQTSQNTTFLTLEKARLDDQPFSNTTTPKRLFGYFDYSWVNDPWIDLDNDGSTRIGSTNAPGSGSLVKNAQVLNLGSSYLLNEFLQIGIELPIEKITTEDQGTGTFNAALNGGSTTGLGDSRLFAIWNFANLSNTSFAVIPTVYMPTGFHSANSYYAKATSCANCDSQGIGASSGGFGAGIKLAADLYLSFMTITANVGFDYHPKSFFEGKKPTGEIYKKVDFENTIPVAIGLFFPILEKFGVNLEYTSKDIQKKQNEYTHPGEILLGLRYWATKNTSIHLAGGTGSLENLGGNDPRFIAGIKLPLLMDDSEKISEPIVPASTNLVPADKNKTVTILDNKLELIKNIEFENGSSKLTKQSEIILDEVYSVLSSKIDQIKSVSINGHTDHIGKAEKNMKLSIARALATKNYLVKKGLPIQKLVSNGFGHKKPKFDPQISSKAQTDLNRRVEFELN